MKKECLLFRKWEHRNENQINPQMYSFVRAYHACRPIDINSYLTHGIQPFTKETAFEETINSLHGIFSKSQIESAFSERWEESNRDNYMSYVFFSLEKMPLLGKKQINNCCHYLLYGSEFIQSVAATIDYDYYHAIPLSALPGVPTVFTCDIPVEQIIPEWLTIRGFNSIDGLRTKGVDWHSIIKIEHPRGKIYDPILQRYRNI